MKVDPAKLPVGEMLIGFLLLVLAVTFVGAFSVTDDDGEGGGPEPTAEASPTPGGETPGGETPAPNGGGTVAISMGDNFFDPKEITIQAGSDVTFDITNDGTAIHNMRIAGEDGKYNTADDGASDPAIVTGGATATLEWAAPDKAGDYNFQCDFHPTDMKGVITVE